MKVWKNTESIDNQHARRTFLAPRHRQLASNNPTAPFNSRAILLVLVVLTSFNSAILVKADRILLYPWAHCANSHLLNMEKLAGILLEDGHNITMLVPHTYQGPYSNTDISGIHLLYFTSEEELNSPICGFNSIDDFLGTPFSELLMTFYRSTYKYCDKLLQSKQKLNHIKEQNFHLAIYDAVDPCSKILADYIDVPFIVFHTSGMESILPRNPAFLPSMLTGHTDKMCLYERITNTISYGIQNALSYFAAAYHQNLRDIHNMNSTLQNYHTFNRAALRLILAEYGLDYVGPTKPNHINVGGFIQPEPQPLPNHLQLFLDNAPNGVAVLSFGSFARVFGQKWRELFARALAQLPMRVIWKYESSEERPTYLGNNTMLVDWFPQTEVLEHQNVKVLITHCGMNTVYEAAYAAVPVVAIPLFADQVFQASKLTKHIQMGSQLDIKKLDSDTLQQTVLKVVNNKDFYNNAQSISKVMRNRPFSQKEEILKWVRYVLFHKGTAHLQSSEHQLHWCQFYLLDVTFASVVISLLVILLGRNLVKGLKCFNYMKPVESLKVLLLGDESR